MYPPVSFRSQRLSRRTLAVSPPLTLLMLVLVACQAPCSCPTEAQTKLDLPHVHRVAALDAALASEVSSAAAVQGIAAYPALNGGAIRALVSIHNTLYALDLTAQTAQSVVLPGSNCQGLALTQDTHYLACIGAGTQYARDCAVPCQGTALTLATLSPDWPPVATVVQQLSAERPGYSSPSWSPDGRYLAVLGSATSGDLTLFARSDGASPLAATSYLRVRESGAGSIAQASWSPDGKYLALLIEPLNGASAKVGLLPISALPAATLSSTAQPPTVDIVPQTLTTASSGSAVLAWAPDSRSITVLDDTGQEQLIPVAVPSGARGTPLVNLPNDRPMGAGLFAWLSDGHSLLFAYGEGESHHASAALSSALAVVRPQAACACVPPAAVMYEYTAP